MKTNVQTLLAAILLALTPAPASAEAPRYIAEDLGTFGASYVYATSLNNAGNVAGGFGPFFQDGQNPVEHAFVYKNHFAADLGSLGDGSVAHRINNSGKVTGIFWTFGAEANTYPTFHAFVSDKGGEMKDLGTLGGGFSYAWDINSAGQVVGASSRADGLERAYLYGAGKLLDLGTLGGTRSVAWGINDAGQVVGQATTTGDSYSHAFLWENGRMLDLGIQGMAVSINNSAQVVGTGFLPSGWNAFLLDAPDHLLDFGPLVETEFQADSSQAARINNAGQVVGNAFKAGGTIPFLYTNGRIHDVNSLLAESPGTVLTAVTDINDRGQMVANGADFHAYILSPVSNASRQGASDDAENSLKDLR